MKSATMAQPVNKQACCQHIDLWFASANYNPDCPNDVVGCIPPPEDVPQDVMPAPVCQVHLDAYRAGQAPRVEPESI